MPPGLVVRPITTLEYHVTLVLQEFATGQPVGIVPHLETVREACKRVKFDNRRPRTHFRRESESTAKIPHRAIAHAHVSPHRS